MSSRIPKFPQQPAAALAPRPPPSKEYQSTTGMHCKLLPPPKESCSKKCEPTRPRVTTPRKPTERPCRLPPVTETSKDGPVCSSNVENSSPLDDGKDTNVHATPAKMNNSSASIEIEMDSHGELNALVYIDNIIHKAARKHSTAGGSTSPRSSRRTLSSRSPQPGDDAARPTSKSSNRDKPKSAKSDNRKDLMEEQLALERAYWSTKYAFHGLRAQAEQRIYSRELTALWTERTDRSPYWANQVNRLQKAEVQTERWRRNPEFLPTPRKDEPSFPIGFGFEGIAFSLIHQEVKDADHRILLPTTQRSASPNCPSAPIYEKPVQRAARGSSPVASS